MPSLVDVRARPSDRAAGDSALAVRMSGISKSFRPATLSRSPARHVLDSIDLALPAGQILAILGPNGAGKTTLLKIIAALIIPDSGNVQVFGLEVDSARARQSMGFASGDERSLYFRLTGRQNLRFFADLYGMARDEREHRVDWLIESFDLGAFIDRRVDLCSTGMRARLGLARAMLHSPRLLLFDEPTKSLDPSHATAIRRILSEWLSADTAAIVTTHVPEEAAQLASSVGILCDGRLESYAVENPVWRERVQAATRELPGGAGSRVERGHDGGRAA